MENAMPRRPTKRQIRLTSVGERQKFASLWPITPNLMVSTVDIVRKPV